MMTTSCIRKLKKLFYTLTREGEAIHKLVTKKVLLSMRVIQKTITQITRGKGENTHTETDQAQLKAKELGRQKFLQKL